MLTQGRETLLPWMRPGLIQSRRLLVAAVARPPRPQPHSQPHL